MSGTNTRPNEPTSTVTSFSSSDIVSLSRIDRSVFGNEGKHKSWFSDQLQSLPNTGCLIAKCGRPRKTVGYVLYSWDIDTGIICVDRFAVLPEDQRLGHGTRLFEQLKKECNTGLDEIVVLVDDTRLNAHLFLKSLGFKATLVRVHKDIYKFIWKGDTLERQS